jgi:nitroimidazol reductase NimA-like FMN-containing flavoprotein (pyridoxamine 5'-phosphate oxidase superfamily)
MTAREIIDANHFMTLATADAHGNPWASPVWFAHADYREFLWVSRPDARHSRNIAQRPEVSIVVFDSSVDPGNAAAVYLSGLASEAVTGIEAFSAASVAAGLPPWTLADVTGGAAHRLYRALVTEAWVLAGGDAREAAPDVIGR